MAGACHGAGALPAVARATIDQVNQLNLAPLADALLAVRAGAGGP
jgi:ADP-ribosylglycohydrolase